MAQRETQMAEAVKVMSFGYSHGIPEFPDQDKVCVIDVRDMKDPFGKVEGTNGKEADVQGFLREDELFDDLHGKAFVAAEGGKMVVFGDGGGTYRSVGMA